MSDFSEPLEKHIKTFVTEITTDEKEDEEARLQKHIDLIEARLKEAFKSIKLEIPPSEPVKARHGIRHWPKVPMSYFLLLGVWALAATLALSFMLGSRYPGLVNTEPVLQPVEDQVLN